MNKLKRFLLGLGGISTIFSCANKINHRPELVLISHQQELQIGNEAAEQILNRYRVVRNGQQVREVQQIFNKLLEAIPQRYREMYEWKVYVLDSPQVNAFALPNGNIFVYKGLLDFIENDPDELAAVLGHEMAHVILRHGAEKITSSMLAQIGGELLMSKISPSYRGLAAQLYNAGVNVALLLPYSRRQEKEADLLGLIIAMRAGYNPEGALKLWTKFVREFEGKKPPAWLSDHPADEERLRYIRRAIEFLKSHPQYLQKFQIPKELL